MLNKLNTLQSGLQTAFGTPASAGTAIQQMITSFKPSPELEAAIVDRIYSSLAPGRDVILNGHRASASFESAAATYEDINYYLDALFSASTPTGPTNYVRSYEAPLTALPSPKFMTLLYGQTSYLVTKLVDCSLSTMNLSGASNQPVQCGGDILATAATTGSLATLSERTGLNFIMGHHGALYMDSWTGTIGTTLINKAAFAWELTINANREYRGYLGDLTPVAWHDNPWGGQLKLSLELTADTDDLLTGLLGSPNAIQKKLIRIKYTDGTRIFQIDFAGQTIQAPELYTDRNGVTAYDLVLEGVYNTTLANWLKISTTCAVATMA